MLNLDSESRYCEDFCQTLMKSRNPYLITLVDLPSFLRSKRVTFQKAVSRNHYANVGVLEPQPGTSYVGIGTTALSPSPRPSIGREAKTEAELPANYTYKRESKR